MGQIPEELIKERSRTIRYGILSFWNKEEFPEEWKESIIVPIYLKGDKTDCSNYKGISLLPTTYKILSNNLLSKLTPYAEEIIGDHQCGFWRKSQLLIIYSALVKYMRNTWNTIKQYISSL
jgi:hypothetical protein